MRAKGKTGVAGSAQNRTPRYRLAGRHTNSAQVTIEGFTPIVIDLDILPKASRVVHNGFRDCATVHCHHWRTNGGQKVDAIVTA